MIVQVVNVPQPQTPYNFSSTFRLEADSLDPRPSPARPSPELWRCRCRHPLTRAEAAVRHMARSLAVEWASQNIRVNCIAWVLSFSASSSLSASLSLSASPCLCVPGRTLADIAASSPGYTLTNLTKVILDANETLRNEWLHRIPMVRVVFVPSLRGRGLTVIRCPCPRA
jgi:hypothetical protein